MARKRTQEQKDFDRLALEVSVKSRRANQRLRQLETSKRTKGSISYQYVKREQYDNKEYITTGTHKVKTSTGGTGFEEVVKFKTTTRGRTKEQLKKQLEILDKFLNAESSTVSGLNRISDKAYQKYKEKTGQNPTREQFDEFWGDSFTKNIKDIFGSKAIVEVIEKTSDNLTVYEFEKLFKDVQYIDIETGEVKRGFDMNTDFKQVKKDSAEWQTVDQKIKDFKMRW